MSETKSTKQIFISSTKKVEDSIDSIRFTQFRNEMRKELNEKWEQHGGELVKVEFISGYVQTLERMIFDQFNKQSN